MRRIAVTGLSVVTAAGEGAETFRAAMRRGAALGAEEALASPRGTPLRCRLATLAGFDPSAQLGAGSRRLSVESRFVTAAAQLAWSDAGGANQDRRVSPERVGTFFGSAYGCLGTTAAYLRGVFTEGMAAASPALFSESLSSTPAGHVAMALDARGATSTICAGDASFVTALHAAWRALRAGRIDRAVVGGFEFLPKELLPILARLSERNSPHSFLGEGVVVLVLEDLDRARATGAGIRAELLSVALSGDPSAPSTDWSHEPEAWSGAFRRALEGAAMEESGIGCVVIHSPPSIAAALAEAAAVRKIFGERRLPVVSDVHAIFGSHAAAGGCGVACALLLPPPEGATLVSAGSWGGALAGAVIAPYSA